MYHVPVVCYVYEIEQLFLTRNASKCIILKAEQKET